MRSGRGLRSVLVIAPWASWLFVAGALHASEPFISEFLASNRSSLLDEDGDSSDWLEVHNPCPDPFDLDGWFLTDDPGFLSKWRLPGVSIPAGGDLVVFASGKDRSDPNGELHANFKISAEGGFLALVQPDGLTIASSFAPYPPQRTAISYGRAEDVVGDPLFEPTSSARFFVPSDGSLGLDWTGGGAFDDSNAAGWLAVSGGIGFGGEAGVDAAQPLAYWDFDGDAGDRTGNDHSGVVVGAVSSSDVPAAIGGGSSLGFDGVDDFVSAAIDVSETAFTSSLWFQTSAGGRGLFTVVDGDLGAGGFDRLLFFAGGNLAARVWNNETISSSGRNFADGAWHHVAHVVGAAAGGQRVYVDGELVASGAKATSDFDWQQRINIGFSNDGDVDFFSGQIDDVAIWSEALSAAQVAALAEGALPVALAGFGPWIVSDVSASMEDTSSTAYLRVPFLTSLPIDFDSLRLRVRYDDGFVAYLNGVEVVRRNAPASLRFDSAATTDRPDSQAIRLEEIDLSAHIGHLRDGANVFAFHVLNDAADNGTFLFAPELLKVASAEERYLDPPTPGAPNSSGFAGFVADTRFSVDRGFFSAPFDVVITTTTPGADIYYTRNGSVPDPDNPAATFYTAPVAVTTTTTLRAAAFKEGLVPTNVDTQTYVFVDDVVRQPANPPGVPTTWSGGFPADYGMDPDVRSSTLPGFSVEEALLSLPTVSVVTDPSNLFDSGSGIYANSGSRGTSWERPASMEFFSPDGDKEFQVDAGIRMHGNSSRNHGFTPKHPIRVLFKSRYGASKLRYRVFDDSDVDRFDQLLLRGASTDSWPVVDGGSVLGVQRWAARHATYFRDQWMRDAQIAMGQPSCHGTYVHLYLNGLYWGVYNLAERPTDSFNAEHLGGDKEEYDVLKDFAEIQSGQRTAWDAILSLAGAGLGSDAAYQRIQGNNPDGSRNPSFERYLDVDNLIDYMVLHITSGAEDWPHHNWWAGRRRGPESDGFKFFVWDQEISNDSLIRTHTLFQTRFEDPVSAPSPSSLYGQLMANPGFRREFGDRVHEHLFNGGLLSPEESSARWRDRQTEIDQAIVAESARWGDSKKHPPYKREVEWLTEMLFMENQYWPGVHSIAVGRFRRVGLYPDVEAPSFEVDGRPQHGGFIERGAHLSMTVETVPSFIESSLVARDAAQAAHVPADGTLGSLWIAADYVEGSRGESWRGGDGGVGYENSTGYEGVIGIDVGDLMSGVQTTVYVRIPFAVGSQAEIDAFDRLTLRIAHDDGFVAYLNGAEIARENAPENPGWDAAATTGGEAILDPLEEFDVSSALSGLRPGTNLLAVHGMNFNTTSSDMLVLVELVGEALDDRPPSDTVFYTLDGSDPLDGGASSYEGPFPLESSAIVRARTLDDGEWSALNEAIYVDPDERPLRVTEIHYHPAAPPEGSPHQGDDFEFVELRNVGNTPLALDGMRIEGGIRFDFAVWGLTSLAPGEVIVIVRDALAFITRYDPGLVPISGEYDGGLRNSGETFRIIGPLGETVLELTYNDDWYPETDGSGQSLVIVDDTLAPSTWSEPASWRPSSLADGSPGVHESGAANRQRPGDANQDGLLDVSDAFRLILHLFGTAPPPLPCDGGTVAVGPNATLFDVNGDFGVDLADVLYLMNYLVRSGPPPSLGPDCVAIDGCPSLCVR